MMLVQQSSLGEQTRTGTEKYAGNHGHDRRQQGFSVL